MPQPPRQRTSPDSDRQSGSAALLTIQRQLQGRLVSRGGRPADPAPTIRRLITIKKDVWKELKRQAAVLSKVGDGVTAGQLAAILLERSLTELHRRG